MRQWDEIPNACFHEDDDNSWKVIFELLKEHGFGFYTPMWVEEDDDMYPEGIGQCPNCLRESAPHIFNMTNTVDGVSWSFRKCSWCETATFFRDNSKWSVKKPDEPTT